MENKSKLLLLIAAVLAVIVTAVVIVGLVNGSWPWDGNGWFGGDYQGMPGKGTTASTTQGDTTDTTGDTGNNKPQVPAQTEEGDVVIDLTGTSKPTTGKNDPTESTGKPTESTGSTSEPTESTGSTSEPTKAPDDEKPTINPGDQGGGAQPEEGDIQIPLKGNDIQFEDLLVADQQGDN